jgi:hypothetical protein
MSGWHEPWGHCRRPEIAAELCGSHDKTGETVIAGEAAPEPDRQETPPISRMFAVMLRAPWWPPSFLGNWTRISSLRAMMQNHWTAEEAQHNLAAKALTAAVKKCDKNGVSPEVTVQTLISVAVTLLLSCTEAEDAASLLERMAASIRSGEITRDYDA